MEFYTFNGLQKIMSFQNVLKNKIYTYNNKNSILNSSINIEIAKVSY